MNQSELALRSLGGKDHHLFDNNGTWWLRYSVRDNPRLNAVRRAVSLGTTSLAEARELRDLFLAHLAYHLSVGAALLSPAGLERRAA